MSTEHPKTLVVDASIAHAAGLSDHPTSRNARQTLQAILTHGHAFGASRPLRDEWKQHSSRFARQWLTSMYARRRVRMLDDPPLEALRQRLLATASSSAARDAMEKDCHLIESALACDQLVLSLDEAARALFHQAALQVGELRGIGWMNPDQKTPEPVPWLERGAPHHETRKLGKPT